MDIILETALEYLDNNDDKSKSLRPILRAFNGSSNEIEASAVITSDGFTLAWVLDASVDQDRYGAMCASLLALSNRAAQEIDRGKLKQVMIEGDNGSMLLVQAGEDTVLALAAKSTANMGMIFIDARKTALKIKEALDAFN